MKQCSKAEFCCVGHGTEIVATFKNQHDVSIRDVQELSCHLTKTLRINKQTKLRQLPFYNSENNRQGYVRLQWKLLFLTHSTENFWVKTNNILITLPNVILLYHLLQSSRTPKCKALNFFLNIHFYFLWSTHSPNAKTDPGMRYLIRISLFRGSVVSFGYKKIHKFQNLKWQQLPCRSKTNQHSFWLEYDIDMQIPLLQKYIDKFNIKL